MIDTDYLLWFVMLALLIGSSIGIATMISTIVLYSLGIIVVELKVVVPLLAVCFLLFSGEYYWFISAAQ